jgi:sigma-B regulation protein RsbU (phosphoserine phosphatase)
VLDFARGRLGGGIPIERNANEPLWPTLQHVVAEMCAAYPDRKIDADLEEAGVIDCDRARIGQLLANLISNAFNHGAPDAPVEVRSAISDGVFTLSVANKGEPISSAVTPNLFKPFFRAPSNASHKSLGLGLYIASEIARGHGGKLDVSSTDESTCFTFTLPLSN